MIDGEARGDVIDIFAELDGLLCADASIGRAIATRIWWAVHFASVSRTRSLQKTSGLPLQ